MLAEKGYIKLRRTHITPRRTRGKRTFDLFCYIDRFRISFKIDLSLSVCPSACPPYALRYTYT